MAGGLRLLTCAIALLQAAVGLPAAAAARCTSPSPVAKPVSVLIVTGGHEYEPSEFFRTFNAMANVHYDHILMMEGQPVAVPAGGIRDHYDVVVFYDMEAKVITTEWRSLLERGGGFVFLHHALGSFPGSPEYKSIVGGHCNFFPEPRPGVPSCSFHEGEHIHFSIVDHSHPVTCGIADFDMLEEAYGNMDIDPAAHVLVKSEYALGTTPVAWTWSYKNRRVFYMEMGHGSLGLPMDHGPTAYQNPWFQQLLTRGVLWAAGRL
jgi:type 1 glutamine amidotransferase